MNSNNNYKSKYVKYKSKYQYLKNTIGINILYYMGLGCNSLINNFRSKLNELYPKAIHDTNTLEKQDYGDNVITYGEMDYEGLNLINKKFNSNHQIDYFFDIGSGRGKLVLYEASEPNITKSYGIELVNQRHVNAIKLLKQLKKNTDFNEFTNKVDLINSDIFNINLSQLVKSNGKVLIWFSNLCFPEAINEKVFEKIINELPKGTIITCSKLSKNKKLKKLDNIIVPMSWTKDSVIIVYQTV